MRLRRLSFSQNKGSTREINLRYELNVSRMDVDRRWGNQWFDISA